MAAIGRKCISTPNAPHPVGPYNQAVIVGNVVHLAGQIGLDPTTGKLAPGGAVEEAEQVMKNLQAVLIACGASFNNVVKTTVFLQDINDFDAVNGVYARYFTAHYPARAAVSVVALAKNAKVEIEAIAVLGNISDITP